jgi:hypothetical protein
MTKVTDLVGIDLSGWKVEIWYEVKVHWENRNHSGTRLDYFSDLTIAQIAGTMAGKDSKDVEPKEIFVLTRDGKTGYLLSGELKASPKSLVEIQEEKKKCVLNTLSPRGRDLVSSNSKP